MQFKIDKTVLIVALTRFLNESVENDYLLGIYGEEYQRSLDLLTGSKSHLIGESVLIEELEFEILEQYLTEV